jgi:protocatechuate 3,4-dioxygenase beta subunit
MSHHDEIEDHDLGLSHDLPTLLNRRWALTALAGLGVVSLVGCSPSATTTTAASAPGAPPAGGGAPPAAAPATADSVAGLIPIETAGPYPGDGSNGPDVLDDSGVVRRDITSSFAGATGKAVGVPLTITMTILNLSAGNGGPLAKAAVYLWHCDRDGKYSMYSSGLNNENYLRGVQVSDAEGKVTFTSIFPGCYDGRWPHIHFEVYPSEADAVAATNRLRTSQIALPEDTCKAVYATEGYASSITNLAKVSLATDNVFGDGYALQLGKATGSVEAGFAVTLNVPV